MPDPTLQSELVRRALARDAGQTIGARDPRTTDVPLPKDDPFSSPDFLHSVLDPAADPQNWGMPGGAIGHVASAPIVGVAEDAIELAPRVGHALEDVVSSRSKAGFGVAKEAMPEVNPNYPRMAEQLRPKPLYSSVIYQPKPGGVLHEVLSRAALKAATGETPTPVEQKLMEHFSKLIR